MLSTTLLVLLCIGRWRVCRVEFNEHPRNAETITIFDLLIGAQPGARHHVWTVYGLA